MIKKYIIIILLFIAVLTPISAFAESKFASPHPKEGLLKPSEGQQFGITSYSRGNSNFHDGLDFGSAKYSSDIHAIQDGEVIFTGSAGAGYEALGSVIVILNKGIYMVYQEFGTNKDIKVKVGDKVKKGDKIATRTSDHLHLGITKKEWKSAQSSAFSDDGVWIDPEKVIKGEIDLDVDTNGNSSTSNSTDSSTTDTKEETQSKYFGADAWKNKMVNFQNNTYKSTFRGIQTGSTGFINNALVLGLNNASNTAIKYAYIIMMILTSALIFFMFLAIIVYMVILPNGMGGYKMMDIFEKTTGVGAYRSKKNTLDIFSKLGLAILLITCLYANLIPLMISGIIQLFRLFIGIF